MGKVGGKEKKRVQFAMFFAAGFFSGAILGVVLIAALTGFRIDMYHQKIASLEAENEDKDIRLQRLEESINKNKFILKDIEVYIIHLDKPGETDEEREDNTGESFYETEYDTLLIEKFIKEKYRHFVGKEVKSIDVDVVAEVVDRRIFEIEDKRYRLKVSKILLADILKIWIEVLPDE
jgi:hypothetical protein